MNQELNSVRAVPVGRSRLLDYIALTKPELTLLSVVTALGGAYLAGGHSLSFTVLLHTFFVVLLNLAGHVLLDLESAAIQQSTASRRTRNLTG